MTDSDWLLYTLEEPLVRHNGQFRRCPMPRAAINPLGIYNDETLKLDYQLRVPPSSSRSRRPRQTEQQIADEKAASDDKQPTATAMRSSAILQPDGFLWPKAKRERTGEQVRVVDIVSAFASFGRIILELPGRIARTGVPDASSWFAISTTLAATTRP